MPPDILNRKALSLIRCLDRIRLKAPRTAGILKKDFDAQDIVSVNLQRAVQLSVDIAANVLAERGTDVPVRMRDAFQKLADNSLIGARTAQVMQKAVGFRNRAVHEYDEIDWAIVHEIVTVGIEDFRTFLRELAAHGYVKAPAHHRRSPVRKKRKA